MGMKIKIAETREKLSISNKEDFDSVNIGGVFEYNISKF